MDTAKRLVHQKVDTAVACQITDTDITAPRLSIGFVQKCVGGLPPVYRDVRIVVYPSSNKRFEKPNVECKHLFWIRSRISALVGYIT